MPISNKYLKSLEIKRRISSEILLSKRIGDFKRLEILQKRLEKINIYININFLFYR